MGEKMADGGGGILAGEEGAVGGDFLGEGFCEDAGLDFEGAAVGDLVVEDGVADEVVHALFVGEVEAFAPVGGEVDGFAGGDEVVWGDHAVVDGGEDGGVGDEGAKFFHEVEGEGGATGADLVVETEGGVEADGEEGDGAVFCEDGVGEGEQGVDGVGGGAAVAVVEVGTVTRCLVLR